MGVQLENIHGLGLRASHGNTIYSDIRHILMIYGYNVFKGAKGIGIYTIDKDFHGYYYVFFAGPSSSYAPKVQWTIVPRFNTKRKSKKSAIDRAYKLAHGKDRRALEPSKAKVKNSPHTGFCLREKKHIEVVSWEERVTVNGRAMLESWCPSCDEANTPTRITKYGNLIDCPSCGKWEPVEKEDYICKICRINLT